MTTTDLEFRCLLGAIVSKGRETSHPSAAMKKNSVHNVCTILSLDFLDCKINRLCITTVFCPLAPVFNLLNTLILSNVFIRSHPNGTVDKPWIDRGQTVEPLFISVERMFVAVERLFFDVDQGALENH